MSRVAVVSGDLITLSRVAGIVAGLGHEAFRVDQPSAALADDTGQLIAVVVSWDERRAGWSDELRAMRATGAPHRSQPPKLILFGSHRDLAGHAEAREAGIARVVARSALPSELPRMLELGQAVSAREGRRAPR